MNSLKTVFFLGLLTGLFLFIGNLAGGQSGMLIALIIAGIMNFISYWFSDKIVLKMYRARELDETEARDIHQIVERLSQRAGIKKPRLYVIDSDSPNAFATGRNYEHSAIALSRGIIELMNLDELEGVIGHEMTHIINRDTLISTISATIAGAIMYLAYMMRWVAILGGSDDDEGGGLLGALLVSILAPFAAMLIQMAISRSREYKADSGSAELTKKPEALASALEKLTVYTRKIPMKNANANTSHLFIVNPLTAKGIMNLFSTHPPVEERIKRLREYKFN